MTQWRNPPTETENYPGLYVHDDRVTGSITDGPTRLPLWAFLPGAIHYDPDTRDGYDPTITEADAARFIYHLLNVRGEFARLLLTLANAERDTDEREDAAYDAHYDRTGEAVVKIWPAEEGGIVLPDPWWRNPDQTDQVRDALQRCLTSLDTPDQDACTVSGNLQPPSTTEDS